EGFPSRAREPPSNDNSGLQNCRWTLQYSYFRCISAGLTVRVMTTQFPVLHHPGTGETIRILESTNDVFRMELTIAPRGQVAAAHIHPRQEQTFEVVAGKLSVTTQGGPRVLGAHDKLVLPPGTQHSQGNPFDEPVVAIETYRPARRMREFFEVFFTL